MQTNLEQFNLWELQLKDLSVQLSELKADRLRLFQDQVTKYEQLIDFFEQNFT